jgi:hypothetical protein
VGASSLAMKYKQLAQEYNVKLYGRLGDLDLCRRLCSTSRITGSKKQSDGRAVLFAFL